jgi:hypothetical protein
VSIRHAQRGIVSVVAFRSSALPGLTEFLDDRLEYRRLFSEVWGTFLLVLVAAGGGAVGAQPYGGGLILPVKVIAPGVMVMVAPRFPGIRCAPS